MPEFDDEEQKLYTIKLTYTEIVRHECETTCEVTTAHEDVAIDMAWQKLYDTENFDDGDVEEERADIESAVVVPGDNRGYSDTQTLELFHEMKID